MKIIKLLMFVVTAFFTFISCQKQLDYQTGGVSVGSLKSALTGDCSPITVNGLFKVDSVLNNNSYVDIQVNASIAGTFDIRSDTVNGYSFSKTGSVGKGLNTIRLYPGGKPIAGGTNTFTVKYGTSFCTFNIFVADAGSAIFILGGAPNACSGFTSSGVYNAGTILTAGNTVALNVNVSVIGTYSITTASTNGIVFSATGSFTNTGNQVITLTGSGTPIIAGNFNFTLSGGGSNCSFSITVLPGGGPVAVYTLGGNPGNCTSVVLSGIYMVGVATSAANTAKVDVTVTTIGSYSLTTTTLNSVKFTASGIFTLLGPQTVTLTANVASPAAAGLFNYTITGAATTCSFPVTYLPAAPPAVFDLSGAPGACVPASVNGIYSVGTLLNASNNVVVEVNVTTIGAYTLATDLVNGMRFSTTGVFSATGLQNVTLLPIAGSNPVTAGISTLTPQTGTSSCTFDITVAAPSNLVYSFTIGATTYTGPCSAFLFDIGGSETMDIYDSGGGPVSMDLELNNPTGAVTTGFYSGTSSSVKNATFTYNSTQFFSIPGSGLTNLSATITSINTVTRIVEGTFSGTVINLSATVFTITNGTFKADY